jgi:hypothetical protein
MLPFLKNQEGSVSMPVEVKKRDSDDGAEYDGLHAAAEDLLAAIESKDAKALALAIRAAFEICDSEPHDEGSHTNEE